MPCRLAAHAGKALLDLGNSKDLPSNGSHWLSFRAMGEVAGAVDQTHPKTQFMKKSANLFKPAPLWYNP